MKIIPFWHVKWFWHVSKLVPKVLFDPNWSFERQEEQLKQLSLKYKVNWYDFNE